MLTENEERFLIYWTEKRKLNKFNPFFFAKGLAAGLAIGLLIVICFGAGWYKRVYANSLNPSILMFALISIALFLAIFYNSFKYEQNEQLYQELRKKKQRSK
jgi:putative Mn2+ efflux pump MntP